VELVGYEDDEAGNFSGDTRSTRLQSCEVHWLKSKGKIFIEADDASFIIL
jgi:hypothetical protein